MLFFFLEPQIYHPAFLQIRFEAARQMSVESSQPPSERLKEVEEQPERCGETGDLMLFPC